MSESWYWKGTWNNSSRGKGGGKQNKKGKGKQTKKEKESKEPVFPAYDAMPLTEASGSSSGSASSSQDSQLKQLMKVLVETSGLKLPEEAKHLLEDDSSSEFRNEMRKTQNQLNKKRKAHAKVQRLKDALQQKHEQFNAFKAKLKEQLQIQQEKYDEDVTSLEKNLKEAEATLQSTLEEEQEMPKDIMEGIKEESELEAMLDMQSNNEKLSYLEDQLKHSRSETLATKKMFNAQAAQMQSYMQKLEMMQATLMHFQADAKGPLSPSTLPEVGKGVEAISPQLTKTPRLGKRDPMAPFASGADPKKQRIMEQDPKEVIPVEGSPEPNKDRVIQGMDWERFSSKAAGLCVQPFTLVRCHVWSSLPELRSASCTHAPIFQVHGDRLGSANYYTISHVLTHGTVNML